MYTYIKYGVDGLIMYDIKHGVKYHFYPLFMATWLHLASPSSRLQGPSRPGCLAWQVALASARAESKALATLAKPGAGNQSEFSPTILGYPRHGEKLVIWMIVFNSKNEWNRNGGPEMGVAPNHPFHST